MEVRSRPADKTVLPTPVLEPQIWRRRGVVEVEVEVCEKRRKRGKRRIVGG